MWTPSFTENLQWLLLTVSDLQSATSLKKRLRQRCFSANFEKFFRTSFLLREHLRMTASCVYLWILRSFSEHCLYTAPLGNFLFHVQVTEFQPPDTVKNCFTGAFQAFYARTRRSHLKAFIYLESLKTICEEVTLQRSCQMPTCRFTKNTFSFMYFVLIFSECITRLWKCASKRKFFQKI